MMGHTVAGHPPCFSRKYSAQGRGFLSVDGVDDDELFQKAVGSSRFAMYAMFDGGS